MHQERPFEALLIHICAPRYMPSGWFAAYRSVFLFFWGFATYTRRNPFWACKLRRYAGADHTLSTPGAGQAPTYMFPHDCAVPPLLEDHGLIV